MKTTLTIGDSGRGYHIARLSKTGGKYHMVSDPAPVGDIGLLRRAITALNGGGNYVVIGFNGDDDLPFCLREG